MTYITGPPDWRGFIENALIVIVVYFALLPVTITLDELSGRNTDSIYISQDA